MDITKVRSDRTAELAGDKKVKDGGALSKAGKASTNALDAGLAAPAGGAEPSDKVNLSHEAQALREGIQAVKDSPDVRADKVKSLRDAIRNGTYKVDNKAVAEKMIKASLEDDILTRME